MGTAVPPDHSLVQDKSRRQDLDRAPRDLRACELEVSRAPRCVTLDNLAGERGPYFSEFVNMVKVALLGQLDLLAEFSRSVEHIP